MTTANHPGAVDDLRSLYRESIRRHSAHPVGFRQPIAATHRHELYNPQCGDRIEIALEVHGDRIRAAAFDGEACAICKASASILCSVATGRTTGELLLLGHGLQGALKISAGARLARDRAQSALLQPSTDSAAKSDLPTELHPLLGVRPYPSRVQCAMLPWRAALEALTG